MKKSFVLSIIISIAMFGTGLFFPMPENVITSYSIHYTKLYDDLYGVNVTPYKKKPVWYH